jgi:hypothetical protein
MQGFGVDALGVRPKSASPFGGQSLRHDVFDLGCAQLGRFLVTARALECREHLVLVAALVERELHEGVHRLVVVMSPSLLAVLDPITAATLVRIGNSCQSPHREEKLERGDLCTIQPVRSIMPNQIR